MHSKERARLTMGAVVGWQDSTSLESYFLAHSVLEAKFIKEDSDWKISELGIRVVWRSGSGMMSMLRTGKEN
ncbi:MAG TPA: hypothetical protein VN843_36325 [Anaerolineales bacterium]|nr:hypothetical protein [Anaerolineales bacterium]